MNKDDKLPIYERQVKSVLKSLATGDTKEAIARKLGYTNIKSLDNYMRRKNFSWDGRQGIFFPTVDKLVAKKQSCTDNSKAVKIITMFTTTMDAKAIAKELGFNSHKDLAAHMSDKGYLWDPGLGNYVNGENRQDGFTNKEPQIQKHAEIANDICDEQISELISFIPLLRHLQGNKERLFELLTDNPSI